MASVHDNLVTLDVSGMTCAACAARLQRVLAAVPGVVSADVSLPLERADVDWPAGQSVQVLIGAVEAAGFHANLRGASSEARRIAREARAIRRRQEDRRTLLLAALACGLALPFWIDMLRMMASGDHAPLLHPAVQAVLAGLAQLICGARFYRGAAAALRGGAANMDVLVVLGTSAAYALSLFNLLADRVHHGGGLYFEAGVTVLAFLLIGKVMEGRARHGASEALEALAAGAPRHALRIVDGVETLVEAASLKPGDVVAVRPGAQVPADGRIIEGAAAFDESLLTGESLPVARGVGDAVIAGAIASGGRVLVDVTASGDDTRLQRIGRLIEDADIARSPTQQLADRISAVFVPLVIAVALVAGIGWWLALGALEPALLTAVAVLVVACPCALGLATPIALVAGANAAARAGLIVSDHAALDTAGRLDRVAFDKTGTLTCGVADVVGIAVVRGTALEALRLAAALAARSDHPLDQALVRRASVQGLALPPADEFSAEPGRGVRGRVEGRMICMGNAAFLAEQGVAIVEPASVLDDPSLAAAGSLVLLADEAGLIAAIGFADAPRPETAEALHRIAALGLKLTVLSGDRPEAVAAFARPLGLGDARAGLAPDAKIRMIEAMRRDGEVVALAGDGVNDAPALRAADLGIAMGSGTEAAKAAASVTLARPDPRLVATLIEAGRATRRTIAENLAFAFLFNGVGIPLAAMGKLSPVLAGAAMAASSVSVALNAWRLAIRRFG
ncbi:MAG TPA: cation-translocating P-type ATPase [Beijerinckiaceae bacterium]|nr:cation-translocating P-type ATPase [Beijerinckiaceae bacterium]